MTILLVEPGQPPKRCEITGDLASMQQLVGGLIQAIYPFEEPVALICNDEGKRMGLPWNRALRNPETGEIYDMIAGTFFLCAAPADCDSFASLSEEQLKRYTKLYQLGGNKNGNLYLPLL